MRSCRNMNSRREGIYNISDFLLTNLNLNTFSLMQREYPKLSWTASMWTVPFPVMPTSISAVYYCYQTRGLM